MLLSPQDKASRVEHVVAVGPPHLILGLKVLHAHDTVFLLELAFNLSVLDYICIATDNLLCLLRYFLILPSIWGDHSSINNGLLLRPQVLGDSLPSLSVGTSSDFVLSAVTISNRLKIRI